MKALIISYIASICIVLIVVAFTNACEPNNNEKTEKVKPVQAAVLVEDYRELHWAHDKDHGVVCWRFVNTEGIACITDNALNAVK